jgi:hypothetical protein
MGSALVTGVLLSLGGLLVTLVLGYTASSGADTYRHATVGVFVTLITLLSHSFMMFYMIGKGKAVKDAVAEGGLDRSHVAAVMAARRPVFSIATLAIALTMATAIVGAGVDTHTIPAGVHSLLGFSAVFSNVAALRTELAALLASSRVVDEVNRQLEDGVRPHF